MITKSWWTTLCGVARRGDGSEEVVVSEFKNTDSFEIYSVKESSWRKGRRERLFYEKMDTFI
jgi:hypothetical protein